MRTFIAIEIPDEIKQGLSEIATQLKKCDLNAKWVNTNNVHLTLKFLGEIGEDKLEGIKGAISETAAGFGPLTVNLKEFGFFPNDRRPRVFFVASDKEVELKAIARSLEDKLTAQGFAKEDRFKSHITLARLKGPNNIDCLKDEMKKITVGGNFPVEAIALVKSTLTKSGPIYEELFTAALQDKE